MVDIEEIKKKIERSPKFRPTYLNVMNYMDNIELFHKLHPFFYDEKQVYWLWDNEEKFWRMTDETSILLLIDDELNFSGSTIPSYIRSNYLEAVKRHGRKNIPSILPSTCVQFKDEIIDLNSDFKSIAIPEYFVCNAIPWKLGNSTETPHIDRLIRSWVAPENVEMMYELLAYCCLPDLPIHAMFVFIGTGSNGKGKFQKFVRRFIGSSNCCASTLSNLTDNRFGSAVLYKKLVCFMGETPMSIIKNTDMLKQITGGDFISLELKNKMPFQEVLYTKILVATNSLPSTEDNSDGFFRRWHIVQFPNTFKQGTCPVDKIPAEEFNNLAFKSVGILRKLINDCHFTGQGSIDDQRKTYLLASNPISIFLNQKWCHRGYSEHDYCLYGEAFAIYNRWLLAIKRRRVSYKEFKMVLGDEGLYVERNTINNTNAYFVKGLRISVPLFDEWCVIRNNDQNDQNDYVSNPSLILRERIESKSYCHSSHFSPLLPQQEWSDDWIIHVKCAVDGCLNKECNLNVSDTPLCKKHYYGQNNEFHRK